MNAKQANARAKRAIVKNLLKGIYDKIGRAADLERFSIVVPLPVEGTEVLDKLRADHFHIIELPVKLGKPAQIRISWASS